MHMPILVTIGEQINSLSGGNLLYVKNIASLILFSNGETWCHFGVTKINEAANKAPPTNI